MSKEATQNFALALIAGSIVAATSIEGSAVIRGLSILTAVWTCHSMFLMGFNSKDLVIREKYKVRSTKLLKWLPWVLTIQILEGLLCQI